MKTQPFDFVQGDDITVNWRVFNVDGIPVDCTGYTATAQLRRSSADSDPTVDATVVCTIATTVVTGTLTHTVTAALSGAYWYDVQIVSPTGIVSTIARGPINVIAETTR